MPERVTPTVARTIAWHDALRDATSLQASSVGMIYAATSAMLGRLTHRVASRELGTPVHRRVPGVAEPINRRDQKVDDLNWTHGGIEAVRGGAIREEDSITAENGFRGITPVGLGIVHPQRVTKRKRRGPSGAAPLRLASSHPPTALSRVRFVARQSAATGSGSRTAGPACTTRGRGPTRSGRNEHAVIRVRRVRNPGLHLWPPAPLAITPAHCYLSLRRKT
jgi:hypothetical protein